MGEEVRVQLFGLCENFRRRIEVYRDPDMRVDNGRITARVVQSDGTDE